MWDVVWDQFSRSAETSEITIGYSNCLVPFGNSPHSEAVLAFGAYGARGAIVTDLQ